MIFTNSMSDLFHELVPFEFAVRVFETMRAAHWHTFQVLTKRPEQMRDYYRRYLELLAQCALGEPGPVTLGERCGLPNVWLGTSIESSRFTWRADVLREVPAAVRFISAEPLLGSLFAPDVQADSPMPKRFKRGRPLDLSGIDWLIVGGESGGRQARPMHPEWARELRDAAVCPHCEGTGRADWPEYFGEREEDKPQCPRCANDPRPAFFFKQWGSWRLLTPLESRVGAVSLEPDGSSRPAHEALPSGDTAWVRYAGPSPKSGGKELDRREWCEWPQPEGQLALA